MHYTPVAAIPFLDWRRPYESENPFSGEEYKTTLIVSPFLPPCIVDIKQGKWFTPPEANERILLSDGLRQSREPYWNNAVNPRMLAAALDAFAHGQPQRLLPTAADVYAAYLPSYSPNSYGAAATPTALDAGAARWCAQNDLTLRL